MNEEVLKNNAEIYSSFEKLLISSEKYKDMGAKVKELTELSDRLNGEIDELKNIIWNLMNVQNPFIQMNI